MDFQKQIIFWGFQIQQSLEFIQMVRKSKTHLLNRSSVHRNQGQYFNRSFFCIGCILCPVKLGLVSSLSGYEDLQIPIFCFTDFELFESFISHPG